MNKFHLDDMVKGWFVGDFFPTAYKTNSVEVGIKRYLASDSESRHFHMVATEITVIVEGSAIMNDKTYSAGDIIVIEPGESTDFIAVTDLLTVVVKVPGILNDKYEGDSKC